MVTCAPIPWPKRQMERRSHEEERYDYEYSEEALQSWAWHIATMADDVKETYVYFNNHYRAKAAKGADMLKAFVRGSDLVRP